MTPTQALAATALAFAYACASAAASAQNAVAVPQLDFMRFSGTWYEVARLPTKAEKKCSGMPLALYARGDKADHLQVVNSCPAKDGSTEIRNANGKYADKAGDGKLKVTYLFPFATKQWVLATAPDYDWALVGSPNHKTLWVLSRTAAIKPEDLAEAKAKASAQGFDTAKLIIAPPPPPRHNRAAAKASSD